MKPAKKLENYVSPIPEGYHTITPALTVRGADKAIEFYKKAFGAKEHSRMHAPDGKSIVHSELEIGNSRFFVMDEIPGMGCKSPQTLGGVPSSYYLYVEDADALFKKAVAAGATVVMPVQDMFWGDRCGHIADPFGYQWDIATHTEDVPPDEIRKRGEAFFKEMGGKPQ